MAGPRTQRKTKVVVKTFKDHGPLSLGDPGAVSRVGRKGGTKVFKSWRKSPWVLTLIHHLIKNSSGCRLLIGHKKCFVLLCPIGEQFLLSSFREFVHDGYCLATLARYVHQACACKGNFEGKLFCGGRKGSWIEISVSHFFRRGRAPSRLLKENLC